MSDASLDYQVRLHGSDQFLHRHDVLRKLDDGSAKPIEVVGVTVTVGADDPFHRVGPQSAIFPESAYVVGDLVLMLGNWLHIRRLH